MDYRLGEQDGLAFLREAISRGCDAPIIIITGQGDREVDITAMKAGAADYLIKGQFSAHELERSMRYAIERKQTEKDLRAAEMKYRNLVERIPALVYRAKPVEGEGSIYINPQIETMLGFSPSEWLADPELWLKQVHPEDCQRVLSQKEHLHQSGEAMRSEHRVLTRDGRVLWVRDEAVLIRDESGHPDYVQGVVVDITDRKQAEQELRLSGEIISNLSEGVYLIRAKDGVIVYTNPRFEEMFGYHHGEMIDRHVSIVNAPTHKSPEETTREIIRALKRDNVWRGEIQNIKKDGTPFWCYASVTTFNHPEYGEVWISIHRDITERKQAEFALLESEERYRSLFEGVPAGLYRSNPGGEILDANPALV